MEVTTKGRTNQDTNGMEGEAKARTRINPRVKMVKALHSILGEQLRDNALKEAQQTVREMDSYLKELNGD